VGQAPAQASRVEAPEAARATFRKATSATTTPTTMADPTTATATS